MDIPSVAMIEIPNLCDKLIPVCMDCFKGCPEIKAPIVEADGLSEDGD
jgi:hypothetical protein